MEPDLNLIRSLLKELEPLVERAVEHYDVTEADHYLRAHSSALGAVDDLVELANGLAAPSSGRFAFNLAQVASDVSESLSGRFGGSCRNRVAFLCHHRVPIVSTYPAQMVRFFDRLARSAISRNDQSCARIAIRLQSPLTPETRSVVIVIGFYDQSLSTASFEDLQRIIANNQLIKEESSLDHSMRAALHVALRMGLKISLSQPETELGVGVQFELESPVSSSFHATPTPAQQFAFWTIDPQMASVLSSVALFHGYKPIRITKLSEGEENSYPLIIDLSNGAQPPWREIEKLIGRSDTAIILPRTDIDLRKQLQQMGFDRLLWPPISSGKLFRVLAGYEVMELIDKSIDQALCSYNILVVDDTATARIILRDSLESLGHNVSECHDGAEFIERIKRGERYDLIFCDQTMPRVDGIGAVSYLRKHEANLKYSTPVVLISAYTDLDQDQSVRDAGFNGYIKKPLRANSVAKVIAELVERRKLGTTSCESEPPIQLANTEIIDLDELKSRCSGKTKLMVRVLQSFLDTSQHQLDWLRDGVKSDVKEVKRRVHTIKGLLREAGAIRCADAVELVESRLKNGCDLRYEDLSTLNEQLTLARHGALDAQAKIY
jgi:CheY-like chemotaxis protein/HPt (histidine-containing phosphotransfer) domain-containing protein